MDGNSSLKRSILFSDRVAGDTRVLANSSYFISTEYVNKFADEVRGRQAKGPAVKPKGTIDDSDDEADHLLDVDDEDNGVAIEGDPTDGLPEAVEEATAREQAAGAPPVAQ